MSDIHLSIVPQLGIVEAYGENESELASALGIYLASWVIVTFVSSHIEPAMLAPG